MTGAGRLPSDSQPVTADPAHLTSRAVPSPGFGVGHDRRRRHALRAGSPRTGSRHGKAVGGNDRHPRGEDVSRLRPQACLRVERDRPEGGPLGQDFGLSEQETFANLRGEVAKGQNPSRQLLRLSPSDPSGIASNLIAEPKVKGPSLAKTRE